MKKCISWNVNGLQAAMRKQTLTPLIKEHDPCILCLQEIRCNDQVASDLLKTLSDTFQYIYINTSKTKKGYSGTAVLSKFEPRQVSFDVPFLNNDEGRLIALTFDDYVLVNVYVPNSGTNRLDYRVNDWDVLFCEYLSTLSKPFIVCGDLNVARHEIDIYNPKLTNAAGFTKEERASFETTLSALSLSDTFRHFYPDQVKYSFWSNFGKARARNNGWRIDYFLVTTSLLPKIKSSDILTEVEGSDHAPIVMEIR